MVGWANGRQAGSLAGWLAASLIGDMVRQFSAPTSNMIHQELEMRTVIQQISIGNANVTTVRQKFDRSCIPFGRNS